MLQFRQSSSYPLVIVDVHIVVQQLADKWHEVISAAGSGQAAIIDVNSWLSKATLDAYVRKLGVFMRGFH